MNNRITSEQIVVAVKESKCLTHACKFLGYSDGGANRNHLKKRIKQLKLDISHWEYRKRFARPLETILTENSRNKCNGHLKKRLINMGILRNACQRCGLTMWQGEKITLQLDHVNGNRKDNRLFNLRILCPNCHSLTPTYGGKNKPYMV